MQKLLIAALLLMGTYSSFAQEDNEERKGGFKKENLFTGGGATVSVASYNTVLGATPVLGYSITRWLDAGIVFNFNYAAARPVYYVPGSGYLVGDDKVRQTVLGPGAFARFYPLRFLFINAQVEQNFISQKTIYGNGGPTIKDKYSATSLLLGVGYAAGRESIGDLYYYISISGDFSGNKNSPYVGISESGKAVITPIFQAGLQIPLFQGRRGRR